MDPASWGYGTMVLDRAMVNQVVVGSLLLVVLALLADELRQSIAPAVARYRNRSTWGPVTWKSLVPLIAAVILALLMWGAVIIQLYLLVVGVAATIYSLRRQRVERKLMESRQILQLILAFRSAYQLQPSVFSTLDRVKDRVQEPLRGLMDAVIQAYYLTSSPERAFSALRERTTNVYLNQFAYILEMSESASATAVVKALDNLVERLRSHDELRRETESSLTSITGQTSVMQRVAGAIVVAVALVPGLRRPYVSPLGQLLYVGLLTVILAGSYYIDRQIAGLLERIS